MLDFIDLPYEFIPPRPNAGLIALARLCNRYLGLPGPQHRVSAVEIRGRDVLADLCRDPAARVVFLPNHPTHHDPQVMTEVCRQLAITPSFMAAYDVFARSRLTSWMMPRLGAFSVDREGSDRSAMTCATEIIKAGKHPLILFPEGNVYLCNDRVTPFAEGAAYLALRAQKDLGATIPVHLVPVSLKYTHLEDVRPASRETMTGLAEAFGLQFDQHQPILEEIKRVSVTALARFLKQHGHTPPAADADIDVQILHSVEQILVGLEGKMDIVPRPDATQLARMRKIRAAVHAIRTDPAREIDHRAASHWADEAMLALRILGYSGGYSVAAPTMDRVAETIARLYEDVHARPLRPLGRCKAIAQFGDPVDLRDHLEPFQRKARAAIGEVTATCEALVQGGVDKINAANAEAGGTPF